MKWPKKVISFVRLVFMSTFFIHTTCLANEIRFSFLSVFQIDFLSAFFWTCSKLVLSISIVSEKKTTLRRSTCEICKLHFIKNKIFNLVEFRNFYRLFENESIWTSSMFCVCWSTSKILSTVNETTFRSGLPSLAFVSLAFHAERSLKIADTFVR